MPVRSLPLGLTGLVLQKVQDEDERVRKERDASFYTDLNTRLDTLLAPQPEGGWKTPKSGVSKFLPDDPELRLQGGARVGDGVGGPEGPTPAWAQAPVVDEQPAAKTPA